MDQGPRFTRVSKRKGKVNRAENHVVELRGIERAGLPAWTKVRGSQERLKRKAKFNRAGFVIGGATRDRTADLLHAMQALSQLSYSPISMDAGD